MRYHFLTRLLHLLLAVAVAHQLIVSLIMEMPGHSDHRGFWASFFFSAHANVGLASIVILGLYFLWLAVRTGDRGIASLFPWVSQQGRRDVVADLRIHLAALRQRSLPEPGSERALVGAVHGLGLLTAVAMAVTGGVVYFALGPNGELSGIASIDLEIHRAVASLMWIYLVGHAGAAILHEFLGHGLIKAMFSLRKL